VTITVCFIFCIYAIVNFFDDGCCTVQIEGIVRSADVMNNGSVQ